MEENNLEPLLGQLGRNIADLEDVLNPLTKHGLSERAKQLPLLDRAKFYALIVYTIESLIFSYLRLHGATATEHPVFRELTRVKQYFEKIKLAEFGPEKPNMQLDKAAADRFIKHALEQANSKAAKTSEEQNKESGTSTSGEKNAAVPHKRKLSDEAAEETAVEMLEGEKAFEPETPQKSSKKKKGTRGGKQKV